MNNGNTWKEIWERRSDHFDSIEMFDAKSLFMELKRIDGFDVVAEGIPFEELIKEHKRIEERLAKYQEIHSVFEVGCGSGADLYLFLTDQYEIGGADYSSKQIENMHKVFSDKKRVKEIICDEAVNTPTDIKYDAVFSNSVFSYFPDEAYARQALDRMYEKAEYSMGLIDVHNLEKKEEFIAYRRQTVEDYDNRYRGLDKLFYQKVFFEKYAEEKGCEIAFYESEVQGYWNSQFVFDVYFYKK